MKGTIIGIDFEKGEFILKSRFSGYDEDAELTDSENQAIEIIKSAFEKENLLFDKIFFRRRSSNYLSLFIYDPKFECDTDFCRIKTGKRSTWVSLDIGRANELKDDARFLDVKNKNQRHWKINLGCINDFEKVTDLIIANYKSIVLQD